VVKAGLLFVSFFVVAVSSAATAFEEKDLIGAWAYQKSYTELSSGQRVDQFGPDPQGFFIILPNHWYSHIVMNKALAKVRSGRLKEMTADESETLAQGTLAHYGTWRLDPGGASFTVTIIKSSFPNFDGSAQTRQIIFLNPTTLGYVNELSTAGDGARVYAWLRRLPP
jgi:hypothetical protein